MADELSKIKSMLTVNTSPIAQAVIAGKLLTHGLDLYSANEREIALYRDNLRRLLAGLDRHFPSDGGSGVTWNVPRGGFFIVLTLPFPADDSLLEISARDYGVLWTPMSYFGSDPQTACQLRLSFSLVDGVQIDEGLERLSALLSANGRTDREDGELFRVGVASEIAHRAHRRATSSREERKQAPESSAAPEGSLPGWWEA